MSKLTLATKEHAWKAFTEVLSQAPRHWFVIWHLLLDDNERAALEVLFACLGIAQGLDYIRRRAGSPLTIFFGEQIR